MLRPKRLEIEVPIPVVSEGELGLGTRLKARFATIYGSKTRKEIIEEAKAKAQRDKHRQLSNELTERIGQGLYREVGKGNVDIFAVSPSGPPRPEFDSGTVKVVVSSNSLVGNKLIKDLSAALKKQGVMQVSKLY